jgi:hypothetical protein
LVKKIKKLSYLTKNDTLKSFPEEATEEQLQTIRGKLREQKKKEQIKFLIAVLAAIFFIGAMLNIVGNYL